MTNADLATMEALLRDLQDDHAVYEKTCGRCKRYRCTHTLGGYETNSAKWKERAGAMEALERVIEEAKSPTV